MIAEALASCFAWGVRGREWAYRSGALKTIDLPARVVSVGNLTVGGAGKTPLVSHLAAAAIAGGEVPWILSRGYGRRSHEALILPPHEPAPGADMIGDEPLLLKRSNPGAGMVVHADRGRIAQEKWNEIRAEFVILDDAFQHWRVCRDFDLVAIDLTGPILPMLVPVGRARELPQALQRADAIVFTRAGEVSEAEAKKKIAELERFFQNEAKENCLPAPWKRGERGQSGLIPFFATTYQASELRHADGMVEPSEALKKRDMIIASGIANPRSFRVLIESLGANVVAEIKKPDHHWLTEKDLQEFLEVQQNNPRALLVITEKDAARWQGPLATNFDQFAFLTVRPKFLGPEVFGSRFRNGQELFPIVRGKL